MSQPISSPLILTLDIGTSSTRAMLFDAQAKAVPGYQAQVTYQANTVSEEGESGVEFEADSLIAAIVKTIDQLLAQAASLTDQIGGVAVDSLVTNILGVDAAGQAITPVYTYADTRNAVDAQAIREAVGTGGMTVIHDRTGCLVHSAYQPARLRWLERTRPELLQQVTRWVSIGEYLCGQLFDDWRISYSVAAWTGLLNRWTLQWDEAWLSELPITTDHLSPLTDFNQPFTDLKPAWAARWPALKNVPWFPAIGDGAAANIGSGCDSPARVALTVGTTGAMRVALSETVPQVPDGLWLYRVDGRRALLGGATTEGGNFFAWLNQTLKLPSEADLEAALTAYPPTAHGLTILPFVAGERAPGWRDDARASIIGFTLDTEPIDLVRAGLESLAYRYALIYRRIVPHLPTDDHQIIASGGALLSSPAWLQMMADVLGQPVRTLNEGEATSRGVALLALEALGVIEDVSDLPPATGRVYQPNADHFPLYQAALEKQVDLYTRVLVNQKP
jgi:gluconokinase